MFRFLGREHDFNGSNGIPDHANRVHLAHNGLSTMAVENSYICRAQQQPTWVHHGHHIFVTSSCLI